ncbi:MAG: hypothetical protein WDZ76_00200 [Pseudohongiellaceae bacterium]
MADSDNSSSLGNRAAGDLRLIRSLMQRSAVIVPMPGWGLFTVGVIGSVTAVLTRDISGIGWLLRWFGAAGSATAVALLTSAVQSRKSGRSVLTGSYSRFWLGLLPAFFAAGILTLLLVRTNQEQWLPGLWLLLYGVGLLAAGSQCIRLISWMGASFLILGAVALFLPWPNLMMGAGFGLTHMVFGLLITRVHHD